MEKILSGVRVLDFTDALAGPYCTRHLADCGCDVISLERPEGKIIRQLPYLFKGQSADYVYNHCGKKSIGIDLKKDGAHDLIMKLARASDVVVENFRPGVMKSLGLAYEDFQKVNPSIIMCSISGWGQNGPYAEMMGADVATQAYSGLLYLSSGPGERPHFVPFAVSDYMAGITAFGAICAALYRRSVTGKGEYIDIALVDCIVATFSNQVAAHLSSNGQEEFRYMLGSFSPDISPCGAYRGRDGWIVIHCRSQVGWERLADVMSRRELASDPRFLTPERRIQNNAELTEIIDEWVQTFDTIDDAVAMLQSYRIMAAPVQSISRIIEEDPQFKARTMLKEIDHPVFGRIGVLNTPIRLKNSEASVDGLPPSLGEHNGYVLHDVLHLDKEEIVKLRKDGVVVEGKEREERE